MWCDAADCCSTLEPQQGLRPGNADSPLPSAQARGGDGDSRWMGVEWIESAAQ